MLIGVVNVIVIIIVLPNLGEHKPGRIKPGRIKMAALSLQNHNCYIFCFLIRPRLYASEGRPVAHGHLVAVHPVRQNTQQEE